MAEMTPQPNTDEKSKIKILIVDDIPETRENLRKLLFFESDIEVVGAATNGQEGVDMAQELEPDVVLMDINMPGMDGIKASELITRNLPYTQVIIMSVQGEADYLRRSMLAGAREFLIKPFSSNELITSVRRVYKLSAEQRQRMNFSSQQHGNTGILSTPEPESAGKVIAVFSPKGGVGCSTLAINFAIALQKQADVNAVIVDTSLQFGDISVLLNLQPKATIADLAPHAEDLDTDLVERVLTPHSSGIKALLAPPRPEMADLVTPSSITAILTKLRQLYDVIILDMYSSLHDTVISGLDEADLIVLVTTPEIPAIKSARLFFEVTDALEYPREKTHLVLNKTNPKIGIRAEDIESSIKYTVHAQFPLDERTAISAANQGIPFVAGQPGSDLAKAVTQYAKQIYQLIIAPSA